MQLIAAKNNISSKMPRLFLRYFKPFFADCITDSFMLFSLSDSGILINISRVRKAVKNVIISNSITQSRPNMENPHAPSIEKVNLLPNKKKNAFRLLIGSVFLESAM